MSYEVILASGIITASFFIQAVFGFGGGLIAVPLLALILDIKSAVSLVMIFQLLTGGLLYSVRRQIDWRNFFRIAPWLVIGAIAGVSFLDRLPLRLLQQLLAAYLILYVIGSLLRGSQKIRYRGELFPAAAGISSGVIQGIFGTGGPMLITYLREVCNGQVVFRATVIAGLFFLNLIRLGISIPAGLVAPPVLQITLITLPLFLAALYGGSRLAGKLGRKLFDAMILVLLTASAFALMVK